jgi:16S rRNA (guanine966-N2)-methyltransferase
MRIISGIFKGRRINRSLPSGTRPTTDSVKETLFNLLTNLIYFENISVLDVFAGSGSLGFEALSRGADYCVFIEKNRKTAEYIKNIAEDFRLDKSKFEVVNYDSLLYLKKIEKDTKFDLIFIDPPYHLQLISQVLDIIQKNDLLSDDGIVFCEMEKSEMPIIHQYFNLLNEKEYSLTKIILLEKKLEE